MFDSEDIVDDLILQGAIIPIGVDPTTGETLYSFTDKLQSVAPAIHKAMVEHFHENVMLLWQKGFLDMDVTVINPMVRLTKKALDQTQTSILSHDEIITLNEIVKNMMQE
jgi:hypothetical protein